MNSPLTLKQFIEINCKNLPENVTIEKIKEYVELIKENKISDLPAKIYALFKLYGTSWDMSYDIFISSFTFGYGLEQLNYFINYANPQQGELIKSQAFLNYVKENKKHLENTLKTKEIIPVLKR